MGASKSGSLSEEDEVDRCLLLLLVLVFSGLLEFTKKGGARSNEAELEESA